MLAEALIVGADQEVVEAAVEDEAEGLRDIGAVEPQPVDAATSRPFAATSA
jgi:hypothetical protein